MYRVGILTTSDLGFAGKREDTSGATLRAMLPPGQYQVAAYAILPDERPLIAQKLLEWADGGQMDLILTTGGTGLGPRDVTPEATLEVIQRQVPGLAEAMRLQTLAFTSLAMLSRGVAGVRGACLIINLPGSPKAVRECFGVVLPVLPHALDLLKGTAQGHPLPP